MKIEMFNKEQQERFNEGLTIGEVIYQELPQSFGKEDIRRVLILNQFGEVLDNVRFGIEEIHNEEILDYIVFEDNFHEIGNKENKWQQDFIYWVYEPNNNIYVKRAKTYLRNTSLKNNSLYQILIDIINTNEGDLEDIKTSIKEAYDFDNWEVQFILNDFGKIHYESLNNLPSNAHELATNLLIQKIEEILEN